jgi:hypothetical protein
MGQSDVTGDSAMRKVLLTVFSAVMAISIPAGAATELSADAAFAAVSAKTLDKEKFAFPGDVKGKQLNIVFLSMSDDQDNGTYQQEALLAWQAALDERGVFSDDVMAYHFPVMEGVPFFVKGIISGAMRDSFEGKVPPDQVAVLFIKDLEAFAEPAGLQLDGQPTIVIATSDAKPLQAFKGEVSPEGVEEIAQAIEAICH